MHVQYISVVVETVSETSHLWWNNETIRFKSSLTSIIIESTYLTLNMNKIWGCFKVYVGWKNAFYGETGSRKGLEKVSARPWPLKKHFLTFTSSINKIIICQFSMFKSLDSMYLTISTFKQVLRSRKGLDYNTAVHTWRFGGVFTIMARNMFPPVISWTFSEVWLCCNNFNVLEPSFCSVTLGFTIVNC